MVAHFADHAADHDGVDAALIRDVAADLHSRTRDVASLAAALEDEVLDPDTTAVRAGVDLALFADHLSACANVVHDLHRRRAS